MAIGYRIDKTLGLTVVVWDGAVTGDEAEDHVRRLADAVTWPPTTTEIAPEGPSMFTDEATIESPQLKVPADLLAEVSRRKKQKQPSDFHVDGWKPSLLERLGRMLGLG